MKENADLLMDPVRDILNSSFSQFINIVEVEVIEFLSDDVIKIKFMKFGICWNILKEQHLKGSLV